MRVYRKTIRATDVFLRSNSPDERVATDNLGDEFALVTDLLAASSKPKLVLDLGGYIGTAAIAFATRIPNCTVISLEPSPDNFRMLKMNTAGHPNIVPVHAAIGGARRTAKVLARHTGAWGHTLVENPRDCAAPREVGLAQVLTIPDVIAEYSPVRDLAPALVKIDIEGSEVELLRDPLWIASWPIVLAELHDRITTGCTAAWNALMAAHPSRKEVADSGEKRISIDPGLLRELHRGG